jgi:hypothetical protein
MATDADFWTQDDEDVEHFHGGHWGMFFTDVAEMLPKLLQVTLEHGELWIDRSKPQATAMQRAAALRMGLSGDAGYSVALIEMQPEQNLFASGWPMVEGVGTHRLTLRRGFLWSNRIEAQLEADFGPSSIAFFDHRFLANADAYREGLQAEFHLCVFAYLLEPADTTPIVLTDPQWPAREYLAPDDPDDPDSPVTIRTEGMAAFFQHGDDDRDDCEFRGPVKAVRELEQPVFGNRTWILSVTVLREDEDIDLDVLLTEQVLGDRPLPKVGDDVQGSGWVQGWLVGGESGIT